MKNFASCLARTMCWCLILLGIATLSCSLNAQQYLGNITGQVADSTGAKIIGAEVTATDTNTKYASKTVTNATGVYTIPFLTPDTYTVTVSAKGFRLETRTGIVLTAGGNQQVDFALEVGTQEQNVVVTAHEALIDTGSANLQTTLSTHEVTELPNVGRNPFVLATMAAGVYSGYYMQNKSSTYTNPFSGAAVQVITNGSSGHNRLTLDGIPDDPAERLSGASYTGFVPSPEAVQEVNVQTGLYDAQYGHGDGVVTNTVLRTGTDKFHGSAYLVFRNTYMNANTYERVPTQNALKNPTPRSNDQWNQPGFVLDGPVKIPHVYDGRGKTYFMVAYERLQLHQNLPYTSLVPTTTGGLTGKGNIGGDFSNLCSAFNSSGVCVPGSGIQIYDPTTLDANNNRTPFPYNAIPAGRINAAGAALMSYYPAPNSSFSPTVNYISSQTSTPNKYFSVVTRVDHSINANNKFNGTFFKQILNQLEPLEGFPKGIGPTGIGYTVYRNNQGGSFDYVSVLPRDYVLDARIGVIYHPFGLVYPGNSYDLTKIGMNGTNLPYKSFPGTSMSDSYSGLAAGNTGQISEDTLGSASVLISKQIQSHSLKVGMEGNLSRYNVQNPQSGIGVFNFNRQFTQQNSINTAVGGDSNSGNPMAALLLGYPSSGTYGNQIAYALQQKYIALFVQDSWRATTRLTVNAGLRWDYESPLTERYNRMNAGFCTTCTNPLQASVTGLSLKGGLTFASSSNRFFSPQVFTNYQPRLGLAYQFTPNVVLRGGIGLVYFNTLESPLGQGFSNSTSYVSTTDNTHPANILSNPWPTGIQAPTGSSLGLATQLGQNVTFPDPDHSQPRMLQWSTSLQMQLPAKMVLQLVYNGNKASRLEVNKQLNDVPAANLATGIGTQANQTSMTNTRVPNPLAGLLPGSSLNGSTILAYQLLVPYPEFTGVQDNYMSIGTMLYNALQVTLNKQLSHGLELQGNLTYAKVMDQNVFLNPQDAKLFRYQDSQPNLLTNIFGSYHFTEMSGKPWYMRQTLGAWTLHGVMRYYNGSLISNPGSTGGSQYGSGTTYTQLKNPKSSYRSYSRYFNTCWENPAGVLQPTTTTISPSGAVSTIAGCDSLSPVPAFQQNYTFTLNTLGPYMNLRQLTHPLVDLSLFKQFQIHEGYSFELRGEFFNALNTPNFGGPGTGPNTTGWGYVTQTQANDPRLTQIMVRLNF
jgi:Carboxypeptidase regulatory-like domain/TonB dependent receptor-like, beta-barrel